VAYSPSQIAYLALVNLRDRPWLAGSALAAELGIHRHTLDRAIYSCLGLHFQAVRSVCQRISLNRFKTATKPRSLKEIANEVGLSSPKALMRRMRGLEACSLEQFVETLGGTSPHSSTWEALFAHFTDRASLLNQRVGPARRSGSK
jgi:AraC-like DNA-binding protein